MAKRDPYELALRALSGKERTEAELGEWLRDQGVGEADRIEVLTRLIEAGVIDDERFALRYAEDKRSLAGWGPDRIREALAARGVGEEHVEAGLASEGEEQLVERAAGLLRERGMRCDSERERDRALHMLARRGYPLEIGYEAVRIADRGGAEAA